MLKIEAINAGYGKTHVLFDVNTMVKEKNITVVVGPNGSGKSTLLKTVMGITQIYSGKIIFNGIDIQRLPPHGITKLGIAYLPQVNNVWTNLKVSENLLMAGYILDRSEASERAQKMLEDFPVLNKYINRRAGTLSGGERQMLAMAMAMMRKPQIILFDEPTGSLAPKMAIEVLDRIMKLRDDHGITLLLVEQNARRVLEYGDEAILLVSGKIMYEGGSRDLLNHPQLGGVYLGIKTA